jgi:hypothetical protein
MVKTIGGLFEKVTNVWSPTPSVLNDEDHNKNNNYSDDISKYHEGIQNTYMTTIPTTTTPTPPPPTTTTTSVASTSPSVTPLTKALDSIADYLCDALSLSSLLALPSSSNSNSSNNNNKESIVVDVDVGNKEGIEIEFEDKDNKNDGIMLDVGYIRTVHESMAVELSEKLVSIAVGLDESALTASRQAARLMTLLRPIYARALIDMPKGI